MKILHLLLAAWCLMFFLPMQGFSQDFFDAIEAGNLAEVKALLKADPSLLNSTRKNGDTPLHYAAYAGQRDIVLYLLEQKVPINQTNKGNATALIYTVYFGHKEVAEILLAKGANCNSADFSGRTSLHFAASNGRLDMVRLLLANGAEIDRSAAPYFGMTALLLAIQNDHMEVATYLIEKGADLNKTDTDGWSPLHWALNRGRPNMARKLISKGADIRLTDNDGKTPTRMAVECGYADIVHILLEKGAVLNEREEHTMRTLLHSAIINGYLNIADLLIEEGADVNANDSNEKTPLFYAKKYGYRKIANLLINRGATMEFLEENSREAVFPEQLEEGEAIIKYLGHCGWAVKTKSHLLIFDYWRHGKDPNEPGLLNGHINPEEIKDYHVYVFVSHEHYDHFDQVIFEWGKRIKNIKYVLGWQMENGPDYIYISPGEPTKIGDLGIVTKSSWDGVPNQGFLVKVDGIAMYHSGDDDSGDMDIVIRNTKQLDLFFQSISRNGGEGALLRIEELRPKAMFPMHYGGREYRYQEFAKLASEKVENTNIVCAENRGDRFFYRNGRVFNPPD